MLQSERSAHEQDVIPAANKEAIEQALARGRLWMEEQLNSAENLPAEVAAQCIGVETSDLNRMVAERMIYALSIDERPAVYPQWQFTVDPQRLSRVLRELDGTEAGIWGQHYFLTSWQTNYGERTPSQCLADPQISVAQIVQEIRRRYDPHQGAS